MKKILIYLIVITAIASSCKKYEEGPCISLRSPEKRLSGKYTIISYTVNGIDSLSLFNDSLSTNAQFVRYPDHLEISFTLNGNRKDGKYSYMGCSCNFDDKNSILLFWNCGSSESIGTGRFRDGLRDISYKILKLTNKEVKLKTLYNNNEYVVAMEKII